jgi:SAM-dependent methyltransferase
LEINLFGILGMTVTTPCKICATPAPVFGVCDFHNQAFLHRGFYTESLAPSGEQVTYHRCPSCGFLFTRHMDAWDGAAFLARVYNNDYPLLDTNFVGGRPGGIASFLFSLFSHRIKTLRTLDYGGGNGLLALLLRSFGTRESQTYDPYAAGQTEPVGTFDLVTCYEVLEHSPDPHKTAADIVRFMGPESLLIFSTEMQPDDIETQRLNWWYVNPRVGHVSFHTHETLARLFAPHGLTIESANANLHFAYRTFPDWAERLHPPASVLPRI